MRDLTNVTPDPEKCFLYFPDGAKHLLVPMIENRRCTLAILQVGRGKIVSFLCDSLNAEASDEVLAKQLQDNQKILRPIASAFRNRLGLKNKAHEHEIRNISKQSNLQKYGANGPAFAFVNALRFFDNLDTQSQDIYLAPNNMDDDKSRNVMIACLESCFEFETEPSEHKRGFVNAFGKLVDKVSFLVQLFKS